MAKDHVLSRPTGTVQNLQSDFVAAGIDSMPVEVAVLDREGTILLANGAWRRFADENHGVHPTHWVGENYLAITEGADEPPSAEIVEGLTAILSEDRDRIRVEYPCHSPRQQRWFMLDAVGFAHEDDRYAFLCHFNVTDRKLAELRTKARSEQLEAILGVLTHDIRNPLQVIDGYAEVIAAELDRDDHIDDIRQAVARITEITEATLAFTRSGELAEVEPLPIATIAREAGRTSRPRTPP